MKLLIFQVRGITSRIICHNFFRCLRFEAILANIDEENNFLLLPVTKYIKVHHVFIYCKRSSFTIQLGYTIIPIYNSSDNHLVEGNGPIFIHFNLSKVLRQLFSIPTNVVITSALHSFNFMLLCINF